MTETQVDFLARKVPPAETHGVPSVPWLIAFLEGRQEWTPAVDVLHAAGLAPTEDNRRWLRSLRRGCQGRVIGGPGAPGYRRTDTLTREEFLHWRATMMSQAREMESGVIAADRVWYARQPVG